MARKTTTLPECGLALAELLVALGLASVVLTVLMMLFLFGLRSFASLGNYASLSGQSRLAMDRMSREIRQASAVVDANTNLPVKWLVLSDTTTIPPAIIRYAWDSATGVLTCEQTGQPPRTNLTGCDEFDFAFFQRSPSNAWTFYPSADTNSCKLIRFSWKCSRAVPGQARINQDMLTTEVVLRNKP